MPLSWAGGRVMLLNSVKLKLLLKETLLDSSVWANYRSASNIPFFGKSLKCRVAGQPQSFLEEPDLLSHFRPGYTMESALSTWLMTTGRESLKRL